MELKISQNIGDGETCRLYILSLRGRENVALFCYLEQVRKRSKET